MFPKLFLRLWSSNQLHQINFTRWASKNAEVLLSTSVLPSNLALSKKTQCFLNDWWILFTNDCRMLDAGLAGKLSDCLGANVVLWLMELIRSIMPVNGSWPSWSQSIGSDSWPCWEPSSRCQGTEPCFGWLQLKWRVESQTPQVPVIWACLLLFPPPNSEASSSLRPEAPNYPHSPWNCVSKDMLHLVSIINLNLISA